MKPYFEVETISSLFTSPVGRGTALELCVKGEVEAQLATIMADNDERRFIEFYLQPCTVRIPLDELKRVIAYAEDPGMGVHGEAYYPEPCDSDEPQEEQASS